MPSTCTPGITVDAAGQRIIDKEHRGVRIYIRLGSIDEKAARQRLASEMEHVEATLQQRAARPRFADAAIDLDAARVKACALPHHMG